MEKLKEIEFDVRRYRVPGIYNNKYDHLFDQNRIFYGQGIYMTHKIDNLSIDKDVVTSVVHGTTDYNVKIKFLPNDEIDVSCECPYHKETNKYCKHIYATLIAVHMKDIREERIKEFHDNIDKTKKIMEDYSKLIEDNKQYLSILTKALLPSTPVTYLNKVKEMEEKFDPNKDNIVLNLAQESCWNLRSAIEHYNYLVDTIIEDKKEYEEEQKNKKDDTISFEFEIGPDSDELFNYLDDLMASQDLSVLEKAKKQLIKEGKPIDVIDKAINERKRRDKIALKNRVKDALKEGIHESIENRKRNKRYRKMIRRAIFSGLFFGLIGSSGSSNPDLNPWEQDYIDKGDYEPFQFEEEDLEDDDFYNEDD